MHGREYWCEILPCNKLLSKLLGNCKSKVVIGL